MQYNGSNHFDDVDVEIKKGEKIFFFSDGLPDQMGGPDKLKLGPKKIRNLIENNREKSMPEIGAIFEKTFIEWMGQEKQMDDVLLIGVAF